MYSRIRIKNFRGFEDLEIKDFKKFNLITGKNNVGKTTILEALFLLSGANNPGLPISINNFRKIDKVIPYNYFPSFFYNGDVSKEISIYGDYNKGTHNQKRDLGIKISATAFTKLTLDDLDAGDNTNKNTSEKRHINGLILRSTYQTGKLKPHETIGEVLVENGQINQSVSNPRNIDMIRAIFVDSTFRPKQLADQLERASLNKKKDEIIDILRVIDSRIQDLIIAREDMIYCDIGLDSYIPINLLGNGLSRILSFALAAADVHGGILIIDEIENSFHYSVFEKVWLSIFEVAERYNTQVFVSTHSYECIQAYNNAYAKYFENRTDNNKNHELMFYRLENIKKQARIIAKSYSHSEMTMALESEWELR